LIAARKVEFDVGAKRAVSGLLDRPADARACYVLAHGAGAGMAHPPLALIADGLSKRGVATLRYQFPFIEEGAKRPDPPAVAHATVRAAVAEAAGLVPELPLFAGGRSFGGRMTSQAQAAAPMPGLRGLIFLAFPLHPAGKPSSGRGAHLADVRIPMLFIQGTRDALAEEARLRTLVDGLGERATLKMLADADHAFHVPARSGRTDAETRDEFLDCMVDWMLRLS
jgi:predicted alpha/beta-hydrolase family hydrolase